MTLGLSLCMAGASPAAITAFDGGGPGADCFSAAKNGVAPDVGIDLCTQAIKSQVMSDRDLAGTYVNRAVIYMRMASFVSAQHDFEQAMTLDPSLGEAVIGHGGALIAQKKYADGIDEISRGLALNPAEPEKAYFNRALAYESLDDLKAAYFDYSKAAQLNPNWDQPREELARFTAADR